MNSVGIILKEEFTSLMTSSFVTIPLAKQHDVNVKINYVTGCKHRSGVIKPRPTLEASLELEFSKQKEASATKKAAPRQINFHTALPTRLLSC